MRISWQTLLEHGGAKYIAFVASFVGVAGILLDLSKEYVFWRTTLAVGVLFLSALAFGLSFRGPDRLKRIRDVLNQPPKQSEYIFVAALVFPAVVIVAEAILYRSIHVIPAALISNLVYLLAAKHETDQ